MEVQKKCHFRLFTEEPVVTLVLVLVLVVSLRPEAGGAAAARPAGGRQQLDHQPAELQPGIRPGRRRLRRVAGKQPRKHLVQEAPEPAAGPGRVLELQVPGTSQRLYGHFPAL